MKTQEQIVNYIARIYEIVQSTYNDKDGNTLVERITLLNQYLAYTSELMADAKFYLDAKKGKVSEEIFSDEKFKNLSPTKSKSLIEGRCALENRIYVRVERLNRTVTHQLEGLRSQLSFLKQQMEVR